MVEHLKIIKTEEPEKDLFINGFIRLEYESEAVLYVSKGAVESIYIPKTGVINIHTFNDKSYKGFKNSYDDIVDQMNFEDGSDIIFEPECDCENSDK